MAWVVEVVVELYVLDAPKKVTLLGVQGGEGGKGGGGGGVLPRCRSPDCNTGQQNGGYARAAAATTTAAAGTTEEHTNHGDSVQAQLVNQWQPPWQPRGRVVRCHQGGHPEDVRRRVPFCRRLPRMRACALARVREEKAPNSMDRFHSCRFGTGPQGAGRSSRLRCRLSV
eukprot:s4253_g4.t1